MIDLLFYLVAELKNICFTGILFIRFVKDTLNTFYVCFRLLSKHTGIHRLLGIT